MKTRPFLTCIVAAVSACVLAVPAMAKDFRMGLLTPPTHIWTQAANDFAQDLKQATGGKHSVAVFPAAQLGNEAQMLQQLQTGALDMAFLTIAELSNRSPNFGALYAPYLVENVQQAGALLRTPAATKLLNNLPATAGVVGVGYGIGGMRQILSRAPINTADDLKGRKLRVTPLDPIRDFYIALGAAPTPLPLPAVFDALANGQVDAIDMDLELIWGLKFFQHANTILLSNHMMFPMVGVVSARVWATLSPDERKQLSELMSKRLNQTVEIYVAKEVEWEKQVRTTGKTVKVVGPEFFRTASEQWEKSWSVRTSALAELRAAAAGLRKAQ
jgi:TRAP-type transport system periplasmic protein